MVSLHAHRLFSGRACSCRKDPCYTEKGLCILLQRLAYPCRYSGMITQFGRSPQELSLIANKVMDEIYEQHGHLLTTLDHPWLTRQRLREMADAVYAKLEGCCPSKLLGVCRWHCKLCRNFQNTVF